MRAVLLLFGSVFSSSTSVSNRYVHKSTWLHLNLNKMWSSLHILRIAVISNLLIVGEVELRFICQLRLSSNLYISIPEYQTRLAAWDPQIAIK